jgi:hypothetical protein
VAAGKGIGAVALLVLLLGLSQADAQAEQKLVRQLGETEIDWATGTISARGGAAADIRMPTADIARPGAERRARAAAVAKLRAALATLALRPGAKLSAAELETALGRAHPAGVDYQSNGGVLMTMSLAFGDIVPPKEAPAARTGDRDAGAPPTRKAPERALAVASMPFELAPRVAAGDKEAALSWAVYRTGAPPAGVDAITVKRDQAGRLVLPKAEAKALQKLAGAPVVIYLQKAPK